MNDNDLMVPVDVFAAILNTFNWNESKILLTLVGCNTEPSNKDMLRMTGIKYPNNYFAIRKRLEEQEYIIKDENGRRCANIEKICKGEKQYEI